MKVWHSWTHFRQHQWLYFNAPRPFGRTRFAIDYGVRRKRQDVSRELRSPGIWQRLWRRNALNVARVAGQRVLLVFCHGHLHQKLNTNTQLLLVDSSPKPVPDIVMDVVSQLPQLLVLCKKHGVIIVGAVSVGWRFSPDHLAVIEPQLRSVISGHSPRVTCSDSAVELI